MGGRCRKRRSATSIFGQPELPVVCRVQPGNKCWKKSAFEMMPIGAPIDTFKGAPAARRTHAGSRFTAIRSWRESLNEMRAATGGIARDD